MRKKTKMVAFRISAIEERHVKQLCKSRKQDFSELMRDLISESHKKFLRKKGTKNEKR